MIVKTHQLDIAIDENLLNLLQIQKDNLLIIDIETTGFSRERHQIYLIGCIYYHAKTWHLTQWLTTSIHEEAQLLKAFLDFISQGYTHLIHYNGDSFDLPFIKARCEQLSIDCSLANLESLDLYKWLKPYKKYLGLPSIKQKDLEKFLKIFREDPFSGGELIGYYYNFVKDNVPEYKHLLLQHNHEDLTGLLKLLTLFYYPLVFQLIKDKLDHWSFEKKEGVLFFYCDFSHPLPKGLRYATTHYELELTLTQCLLKVPYQERTLKYFFQPYSDYYYLPEEDQAIHKSVASFVHPSRRQKAKASTCYIKKRGAFIPLFNKTSFNSFKEDYQGSMYYVLVEDVLKDTASTLAYLSQVLRSL